MNPFSNLHNLLHVKQARARLACKPMTSNSQVNWLLWKIRLVRLLSADCSPGCPGDQDGILTGHPQSEKAFSTAEAGSEVRDLMNGFEKLDAEEDSHAYPEDCKTEDSVSEELEEERGMDCDVVAEEDIPPDEDSVPEELESSLSHPPDSPKSAIQAIDACEVSLRSAELEESLPTLTPREKGSNALDTPNSSRSGASSPSTPATDYETMGCSPREEMLADRAEFSCA